MECQNPKCLHEFDATDEVKIFGRGDSIEVRVVCPACESRHVDFIDAENLVLEKEGA